jgi:hypothetical protein
MCLRVKISMQDSCNSESADYYFRQRRQLQTYCFLHSLFVGNTAHKWAAAMGRETTIL